MVIVAFGSPADQVGGLAWLHDDGVLADAEHGAANTRVIHP